MVVAEREEYRRRVLVRTFAGHRWVLLMWQRSDRRDESACVQRVVGIVTTLP